MSHMHLIDLPLLICLAHRFAVSLLRLKTSLRRAEGSLQQVVGWLIVRGMDVSEQVLLLRGKVF